MKKDPKLEAEGGAEKRKDNSTRIEVHLLIAEVEQNIALTDVQTVKLARSIRWDRELPNWLITYRETMENQVKSRVSLLLSYLDLTAGPKAIYPRVLRIVGLPTTELKEKYCQNPSDVTEQTIQARLDDHRWNVVISHLDKLVPSLLAEQPEQMAKKCEKRRISDVIRVCRSF